MCKFYGEGLKESGRNLNVVNVLRTLVEDENCEVYIPYDYNKESKYCTDPDVEFIPNANCEVIDMVSNQERFNYSITYVIPVIVKGENKKVFRNYTVIRDGKLNVESIWASVNGYYDTLKNAGCIKAEENGKVEIDLTSIPLISVCWAQPTNFKFTELIKREAEISEELKCIRKIIKDNNFSQNIESDFYYESKTTADTDRDKICVHCVVYDIPEFKFKANENNYPHDNSIFAIKKSLDRELKEIRFKIRTIVWAVENSAKRGSYEWTELADLPRSKDKKFQTAKTLCEGKEVTLRRVEYNKAV